MKKSFLFSIWLILQYMCLCNIFYLHRRCGWNKLRGIWSPRRHIWHQRFHRLKPIWYIQYIECSLFWPIRQSRAVVEPNLSLSQDTPTSWYTYRYTRMYINWYVNQVTVFKLLVYSVNNTCPLLFYIISLYPTPFECSLFQWGSTVWNLDETLGIFDNGDEGKQDDEGLLHDAL